MSLPQARNLSQRFSSELREIAEQSDATGAREIALEAMSRSHDLWRQIQRGESL